MENESFQNHADYALDVALRSGLRKLRKAERAQRLCCDANPSGGSVIAASFRIIITTGETVIHILAKGRTRPAGSIDAAVSGPKSTLVYPHAKGSTLLRVASGRLCNVPREHDCGLSPG